MKTVELKKTSVCKNRKRCHVVASDTEDTDHSGHYVPAEAYERLRIALDLISRYPSGDFDAQAVAKAAIEEG